MAPTGVWNPNYLIGSGIVHFTSGYIGTGIWNFTQPNVIIQTPEECEELKTGFEPDEGFKLRGKL